MAFLLVLLALLAIWLLSNIFSLLNNYRRARSSNLPILIGLGNPDNLFWFVLSMPLRRTLERLTSKSFFDKYLRLTIAGWEFRDKNVLHEKVGPIFLLVSPGDTELWVADPAAAQSILTQRKEFMQSKVGATIMDTLGPSMITANGDTWARQRRLIAPNLNERISETVWKESTTQATSMTHHLLSQPKGETDKTLEGLRSIALNVLGQAGYGQSQEWSSNKLAASEDGKMTYFEAVSILMAMLIPAAFCPTWLLRLAIMPKVLRDTATALDEYPGHTTALLDKERALARETGEERSNFLAMLARMSDVNDQKSGLTPEEIQGNLFLFTAAGFETTANTLAYAIMTLAIRPDLQDWLFEELDHVLPSDPAAEIDYKAVFPRLIRCLYETLRVYPALLRISRYIWADQYVKTHNESHLIKAPAKVSINTAALHYDIATWGADALEFKPERWFAEPTRMKMAQVEFVAVIATLFRSCRAEIVMQKGETLEQARERLIRSMDESEPKFILRIENPEDVGLRWVKRQKPEDNGLIWKGNRKHNELYRQGNEGLRAIVQKVSAVLYSVPKVRGEEKKTVIALFRKEWL
ncbi:hypothetical protein FKW77_007545 [Venturia effusa]|uniref:Cytochrome P450 n=1 Tax=Venturia effusa TaxID=50376 RepID=A0A517L1M1_9PEZI|nr:hypothetical protein FKW77_007545 [Venturia effusa]